MMKLRTLFSTRLCQVLDEKEWSDKHLADKCDLARSYIGKLKKGDASPPLETIEKIAEALSIDPLSLLSDGNISPRQALSALNEYFNWSFIPKVGTQIHEEDEKEAAKRVLNKIIGKSKNKKKKIG